MSADAATLAEKRVGAEYGQGSGEFICSTLVIDVAREMGIGEGLLDPAMGFTTAKRIAEHLGHTRDDPARGDLVFFEPNATGMNPAEWHIAVALNRTDVVHACPVCQRVVREHALRHKDRWRPVGRAPFPTVGKP